MVVPALQLPVLAVWSALWSGISLLSTTYNELISDPAFHPYRAKLKRQRAIALRVLANTYLAHGQGTRARQYLLRSLQDSPNPKSAVSLGISFIPCLIQQRILQKLRG